MKIKMLSIAAIIVAGILVIVLTVSNYLSVENAYNNNLALARSNAKNKLPYNAYHYYQEAFAIRCESESIYQEYVDQAKLLGKDFYYNALTDYIVKFPSSAEGYELLCEWYYEQESHREVINTALEAREKGIATDKVRDRYLECAYMFEVIKTELEEAQSFLGSYALVKTNGLYGYIKTNGAYLLDPSFIGASAMMGTSANVNDGEEWHMINAGGYKIARTTTPVDLLTIPSGSKISVSKDGKYGYASAVLEVPEKLPYEYASVMKGGVAAVKKDGKWALIDSEENLLTKYVFEDVLLDEFGACCTGGVIFVKVDGKYRMVDTTGAYITDQTFDDAQPFASAEPAAVCIDGKWGFVDTAGNVVIKPKYDGARSFSISLGGVCVDGKWGYINPNGDVYVDCQFEDCKPFAANGIAAVKKDETWRYIQLLVYQN